MEASLLGVGPNRNEKYIGQTKTGNISWWSMPDADHVKCCEKMRVTRSKMVPVMLNPPNTHSGFFKRLVSEQMAALIVKYTNKNAADYYAANSDVPDIQRRK